MPHFSIGKRARFDQNVKAYVEETIFLSNNGAPVSNVNWNVKTFIVVDNNNTPPGKHILVPINGYYAAQFPTSAVTGELSSIVGVENNAKFSRIYRESIARNAGASVDKLVFIQETTISIVNYEDRFGRKGVTYFRDYSKVSEDSIRPLLQRKQEVPPLDIDNATFDDVLKRAAMPDALTISF
jgi:hypothetical protein